MHFSANSFKFRFLLLYQNSKIFFFISDGATPCCDATDSSMDIVIISCCKRQVYLLCRWERHLKEFPDLGVADRWPATSKRTRTPIYPQLSPAADISLNVFQNDETVFDLEKKCKAEIFTQILLSNFCI